ncbi:hypothetical protein GCM10008090_03190 [Arenicella chitinivorans]|uniref:BD-FAE-like domain-containing protein n=1 Tax=Arenicella chitinivorans TaxID=1329800 RepID=A0A918VHY9_9GAMM|nr:alpha/beta hydrolase [Arenicella chitinivorans]GGZ98161.1 hypothetical protein GCM10008090_03190 [Arenicella chitinivorans]
MKTLALIHVIICFALAAMNHAAATSLIERENNDGALCDLPSARNVAYSAVTALPVSAPSSRHQYGESEVEIAELWLPSGESSVVPEDGYPVVIFIHGGCWLNQFDISHSHAMSTALRHAGYAVWSLEYRRTGDPNGGWPNTYTDVLNGIDALFELDTVPLDLSRVVLTGHSAGGHLALLAGSDRTERLQGVIGLAAIVDIERYARGKNSCQTATPAFMGGTPDELVRHYREANPIHRTLHPMTRLLHGDLDSIVPIEQTLALQELTQITEGAGHFDWVHPGTPAFKSLLRNLAELLP